MRLRFFVRLFATGVAVLSIAATADSASASTGSLPWYSGMRALGQSTIEPAVDYANGRETFLHTPNTGPFCAGPPTCTSPQPPFSSVSAPLYLVLYPDSSTIPASTLNCTPYNCNHAQIPGIKGHDHLVGLANTGGDFNVPWHVIGVVFTGNDPAAQNTRILTLDQLNTELNDHDVAEFDTGIYFMCSRVSASPYQHATPLSFPWPPA